MAPERASYTARYERSLTRRWAARPLPPATPRAIHSARVYGPDSTHTPTGRPRTSAGDR